jgi:hypothetical protein
LKLYKALRESKLLTSKRLNRTCVSLKPAAQVAGFFIVLKSNQTNELLKLSGSFVVAVADQCCDSAANDAFKVALGRMALVVFCKSGW